MRTDPAMSHAADIARAMALHGAGQPAAAAALYREVLAADPGHFDALHLLGVAVMAQGQAAEALALIDRALAVHDDDAAAHCNRAVVLALLGRHADAAESAARATALKPDFASAHFQHGNALKKIEQPGAALEAYSRALECDPAHVEARVNRAVLLSGQGRHAEALADAEFAVARAHDNAHAHYNCGFVLMRCGETARALTAFRRAVALQPDLAEAQFGVAECLLSHGDFTSGWPQFEWRLRFPPLSTLAGRFTQPRWDGKADISGKTILLTAEQGFGDVVQFCRYAHIVRRRGARVMLEVHAPLVRLLSQSFADMPVIAHGAPLPPFDVHCPLMSLPFVLGAAEIPADVPYLTADPVRIAAWRERFGASALNVGVAWAGRATHQNDANRSATLFAFKPLNLPGVRLVALQPALTPAEQNFAAGLPGFVHVGDARNDFAEVAAQVAALDAVVTVDTVFAHIAGALGKPVFIVLSRASDWRWLQHRADSAWYPTARLLRQDTLGDWSAPLMGAAKALREMGK